MFIFHRRICPISLHTTDNSLPNQWHFKDYIGMSIQISVANHRCTVAKEDMESNHCS